MSKGIILVADDDAAVLDTTVTFLEFFGYTVISANNGFDAISLFKKHSPELVFLDVKMPKLDGYETFFKLHEQFPNVKAILMTAHADYSKWDDAKNHGALELIEKPYSAELLKKLVTKYCP